jgi:tetratricopeptide (TPR) repeat protein
MRKNILLKVFVLCLLFLAVFPASRAFASEAATLMEKGNEYYQNKDYNNAIDMYQKIIEMGYESAPLYYNLGNAYYREGKLGYSILYYEKALKLAPGDDDAQHNLAIANSKTIDKIDTLPQFFLFQWWESFLALFNLTGWTCLAYAFYIILLISIGLYFFLKKPKLQRYSFFTGFTSIILLAIAIIIVVVKYNREVNIKNGIIVESVVNAKLSPDSTASDAFIIHEGLKVSEEDRVDNWIQIKLQDGKEGWIPQEAIKRI